MSRARALLAMAVAGAGCSTGPTTVRPSPGPTPLVEPVVTIVASGVTPQILHIASNTGITFVNRDVRAHEIRSDPHPAHTECALMNLGPVESGQARETAKIAPGQGCGYHAEGDPANRAFQGFVLAH